MGRGKSQRNLDLIDAAYDILNEINPASVRGACYQLFTRKLIASMARSETCRVSKQLTDARERGDIPWHWIVDETREAERVNAWKNPAAYFETVRRAYRRDRWTRQKYHVEVWSEKGTVRGTLAPVLDEYGVTFRVMHGYGSATVVHDIAEEIRRSDKPWVPFYVGDWDMSGLHMSEVDLPDRLARYGARVEIVRVALTADQIIADPTLPSFRAVEKKGNAKKKGDARYDWFQDWSRDLAKTYGEPRLNGRLCWELDALNPVVLRASVEAAIRSYLDLAEWDAATRAETAERESIVSILATWPGISGPDSKYDNPPDGVDE